MATVRKFKRAKAPPLRAEQVRAIVRHRDGYRCIECGISALKHIEKFGRNLDVHRKTPGSPYTVRGCVTLCRTCHGPQSRRPRGSCGPSNTVPAHVSAELYAILRAYAREQRRSLAQVVELLLEEVMASKGKWPPPDEPEE